MIHQLLGLKDKHRGNLGGQEEEGRQCMQNFTDRVSMLACLSRNWEAALILNDDQHDIPSRRACCSRRFKSLSFPLGLADKLDLRRGGRQRRNTKVTRKNKQNELRKLDHGSRRALRCSQLCVTQSNPLVGTTKVEGMIEKVLLSIGGGPCMKLSRQK